MYDDNRRLRPDFQVQLPQWIPMGDDDQEQQASQATGSFVDLLKKRMMGGSGKAAHAGMDAAAPMHGDGLANGSGGGGGGMKSL